MARGGINKAVVQKARHTLLTRGKNPSIDAVRVELGNTGSKTTISRYLKEIESFDPRPISSRERLGDELCAIVENMLDRVMEEGDESIQQARSAFELQRVELETQVTSLQSELAAVHRELTSRQAAMETQSADLQTTQSSLQSELTRNAGLSQRCSDLEILVADKGSQIQMLEEKHVQARGALEHYRDSVKEQREQDQRRHESQLHEMQVEQRKLRATLAVKQDDVTRLNRDNERLSIDARQLAKTAHTQEAQIQSLTGEVQTLRISQAKAAGVAEQMHEQLSTLREEQITLAQAATLSNEREVETRLQLAAAQVELELMRRHQSESPVAETESAGLSKTDAADPDTKPGKNSKSSWK